MTANNDILKKLEIVLSVLFLSIFISFGRLLTTWYVYFPSDLITTGTQLFLFLIFICSISYKGYYFSAKEKKGEFLKKFFTFLLLLLPFELFCCLSNGSARDICLALSIIITICYYFVHLRSADPNSAKRRGIILPLVCGLFFLLPVLLQDLLRRIFGTTRMIDKPRTDFLAWAAIFAFSGFVIRLFTTSIIAAIRSPVIIKPIRVSHPSLPGYASGGARTPGLLPVRIYYAFIRVIIRVFIHLIWNTLILNLLINAILRTFVDILLRTVRQLATTISSLKTILVPVFYFTLLYTLSFALPFVISYYTPLLIDYLREGESPGSFHGMWQLYVVLTVFALVFRSIILLLFTTSATATKQQSLLGIQRTVYASPLSDTSLLLEESVVAGAEMAFLVAVLIAITGVAISINSPQPIGFYTIFIGCVCAVLIIPAVSFHVIRKPSPKQSSGIIDTAWFKFLPLQWSHRNHTTLFMLLAFLMVVGFTWQQIIAQWHTIRW